MAEEPTPRDAGSDGDVTEEKKPNRMPEWANDGVPMTLWYLPPPQSLPNGDRAVVLGKHISNNGQISNVVKAITRLRFGGVRVDFDGTQRSMFIDGGFGETEEMEES